MIQSARVQSGSLRSYSVAHLVGICTQGVKRSTSPAAVQAEASRCVGLDADALREAAEYLQLQYRKLHESEAYLSSGKWERRSRLVTIKVTDFEFEAMKVSRAAPPQNQPTENTAADDCFVQGELFPHIVDLSLPSMREGVVVRARTRKSGTRGP